MLAWEFEWVTTAAAAAVSETEAPVSSPVAELVGFWFRFPAVSNADLVCIWDG